MSLTVVGMLMEWRCHHRGVGIASHCFVFLLGGGHARPSVRQGVRTDGWYYISARGDCYSAALSCIFRTLSPVLRDAFSINCFLSSYKKYYLVFVYIKLFASSCEILHFIELKHAYGHIIIFVVSNRVAVWFTASTNLCLTLTAQCIICVKQAVRIILQSSDCIFLYFLECLYYECDWTMWAAVMHHHCGPNNTFFVIQSCTVCLCLLTCSSPFCVHVCVYLECVENWYFPPIICIHLLFCWMITTSKPLFLH